LTLDGETYRLALNEKRRADRRGDIKGLWRGVSTIDLFLFIIARGSVMKSKTLIRRPA
jgi:hypothetical protein